MDSCYMKNKKHLLTVYENRITLLRQELNKAFPKYFDLGATLLLLALIDSLEISQV